MASGGDTTYGSALIFVVSASAQWNNFLRRGAQDQGNLVFLGNICGFKCIRVAVFARNHTSYRAASSRDEESEYDRKEHVCTYVHTVPVIVLG